MPIDIEKPRIRKILLREKAGLLNQQQKAILGAARQKGLIPDAEKPSALQDRLDFVATPIRSGLTGLNRMGASGGKLFADAVCWGSGLVGLDQSMFVKNLQDSAQDRVESAKIPVGTELFGQGLGTAGNIMADVAQFGSGYLATGPLKVGQGALMLGRGVKSGLGALKGGRAAGATAKVAPGSVASKVTQEMARGAVADFAAFVPEENLSTTLRDVAGIHLPTAINKGDSELVGRLKNMVEGAGIGGVASGILRGGKAFLTKGPRTRTYPTALSEGDMPSRIPDRGPREEFGPWPDARRGQQGPGTRPSNIPEEGPREEFGPWQKPRTEEFGPWPQAPKAGQQQSLFTDTSHMQPGPGLRPSRIPTEGPREEFGPWRAPPPPDPPNPTGRNPDFINPDSTPANRMDQAGNMGAADSLDTEAWMGGPGRSLVRLFGSLGKRMSTYGGGFGRRAQKLAEGAIDAAKKFEGLVSNELDIVSKLATKPGWTGVGQAATDLGTPVFKEGEDFARSPLHQAIESAQRTPQDKASKDVVESMRNLIHKLGQVTTDAGLLVEKVVQTRIPDGKGGFKKAIQRVPFESFFRKDGGIVAPRIMTGEFFDIIRRGESGELWHKTIDAFAAVSRKVDPQTSQYKESIQQARERIRKVFTKKHNAFHSDVQGSPQVHTQAEFERTLDEIPAAIRHNGETIYLQVTHPHDYARALVSARTNRLGFISKFGQEFAQSDGRLSVTQAFRRAFKQKGEGLKQFDQLVRGLHGVNPTDPLFDPGSWASRWSRRLNSNVMRPMKAASLTGSFVPNLWEPLGNILTLAGGRVLAKSIVKLARDRKGTIAALEQMGAINREFMDLSWDKNFKTRSLAKGVSELTSRVFLHKHLNQFQEVLSALVASEKTNVWKKPGKGTGAVRRGSDIANLRQQGFSLEEATGMVDGSASDDLYEKFIRGAPAKLTAGNIRPAERSFFEHNRIVRQTIPFQTYAQMKIRSFASHLDTFKKTYDDALTNPNLSPDERYGLLLGAAKNISSNVIGTSAAGGLAGITTALYFGGTEGTEIELNRMEENFGKYMLESWAYASIGGPFGALLRVAGDRNKVWGSLYPVSMGVELFDSMLKRKGRYQGMGSVEAALEFSHNFFPGYRAMRGGVIPQAASWIVPNAAAAAAFGMPKLGSERGLDAIISGLRKAQYEEGDIGSYSNQDVKDFTLNMRFAYKALKSGKHPKVVGKHIREALQETGGNWSKVAASINRRRLLQRYLPSNRDTPVETKNKVAKLLKIKKRLGEKNFLRAVQHDKFLTAWAKELGRIGT